MVPKLRNMRTKYARQSLLTTGLLLGSAVTASADYGDALDTGAGGISQRYVVHAQRALEQGHITEAIDYSNRALALHPDFVLARFTRGRAELAGGDTGPAIADFDRVIASYPEYPMVYAYRAEAYLWARNPGRAIVDFNNALLAPVGTGFWRAANIFAVRSVAQELAGQPEAAVKDLKYAMSAVAITTHDWSMLNNRCYAAAVVGLLETAGESCNESIDRHSRDISVYDSRGLVELKQHAWERAIADYTQSLYYRPALSTSLYGRSLAKQAKGDRSGAAADFGAALAAEPHIVEIMGRLGVSAPKP